LTAGPVLSIRDLTVQFATPAGTVHAVTGASIDVHAGEVVGVVGESGCGKTVTMLASLRLLPEPPARIVAGEVLFRGRDLLRIPRRELRRVRGREIGMVFQDPLTSLHPSMRVGDQIAEAMRVHEHRLSSRAARARAVELLELVGVARAAARARDYPHQWSGGMRQRAMIAAAIANRPSVLIADEPTTALDVTIQAQVLDVLRLARAETGAATVLVSHDLGVIAEMADRVVVMYGGRVVETGPVHDVFARPRHPYTAGLLASVPRLDGPVARADPIPGQPPTLLAPTTGCAFVDRCPTGSGRARCRLEEPRLGPPGRHPSACHFPLPARSP
jgi:oligopeptide/dipeptide ABC transporter ATP-binding protein